MYIIEKIKNWYDENKKYVLVSGTVGLSIVGAGVCIFRLNGTASP